eukprot:TRINITY_DN19324_c0_g1_i2.p1 TRINITY_DN19324_c0_g1~~TRINITY_DN19324_c0_g1_i2.p1  ORF type:complete len:716 (-),score=161.96 TRINITY_DN19324_c0_g1_i2:563-2710(-)
MAATSEEKEAKQPSLSIVVPADAKPGETQLRLDLDALGQAADLVLTVPPEATCGDQLLLTRQANGSWACSIRASKSQEAATAGKLPEKAGAAGAAAAEEHQQRQAAHEITTKVPADATPGVTKLHIKTASSGTLAVLVPAAAAPGDLLQLSRAVDSADWQLAVLPQPKPLITQSDAKQTDALAAPGGARVPLALPRMDMDISAAYARLAEGARRAGAYVNPKLERGNVLEPPANMAGMYSKAVVEENEELLRIPETLHMSPHTAPAFFLGAAAAAEARKHLPSHLFSHQSSAAQPDLELALAAWLARLLALSIHGREGRRCGEGKEACSDDAAVQEVWSAYCDVLLGEDFSGHPYWLAMGSPPEAWAKDLMLPSREWEHAYVMARRILAMHAAVVKAALLPSPAGSPLPASVPTGCAAAEEVAASAVSAGLFVQAWLARRTRAFHTSHGSSLVPVVDLFNHSAKHGADWRWDKASGDMVLTALRRHEAGEEICISYGIRPNTLLFRTYGFTLDPAMEPAWSYVLQGVKPGDLYRKYLPERLSQLNIQLDSKVIQDTLIEALNACVAEKGEKPDEFVKELCEVCMAAYEADPLLQPALDALRKERCQDPGSERWWSQVSRTMAADLEAQVPVAAEASRAGCKDLATACVRLKMSEYLCLTAHREAVAVYQGAISEEACLRRTADVRSLLADAFQELGKHGRFECNTVVGPVVTRTS